MMMGTMMMGIMEVDDNDDGYCDDDGEHGIMIMMVIMG